MGSFRASGHSSFCFASETRTACNRKVVHSLKSSPITRILVDLVKLQVSGVIMLSYHTGSSWLTASSKYYLVLLLSVNLTKRLMT